MVWHPDMDVRRGLRTARLVYKALLPVANCRTRRRSDVRHGEHENFGDNYFLIFKSREDLVRDHQDEVYSIYAT